MSVSLVVMAAGLGSRYGGLKQIAPVDPNGHILMDYSIYDALRAGFDRVVCIIKPEMREDFYEVIGHRLEKHVEVRYAYQRLDNLPAGYSVPEGRTKPWGTAHALLCAKEQIDAPFAVINADDFYGRDAFAAIAAFLREKHGAGEHAMVGYRIENTLTENGYVSRGVCETDERHMLTRITERVHIEPREGGAAFTEDGESYTFLPAGTMVSMNMWAFSHGSLDEMRARFADFLDTKAAENPLKAEYYLPSVPDQLIREGKAQVRVLPVHERWYGVTYHDDLAHINEAMRRLCADGTYPEKLWQ